MKYWYDTEFYEDGQHIHLISIGIVAEDGRELYMENVQFDWDIVPPDHWIQDNVRPHLQGVDAQWSKAKIASMVKTFVCDNPNDWSPNQLWGYYSAYDHVVLAQLFGRMVDMPSGLPWFTMDIKQLQEMLKNEGWDYTLPEQEGQEHHALSDARWNKVAYDDIMRFAHGEEEW